jgi:broad specificity phosphatase PhoE
MSHPNTDHSRQIFLIRHARPAVERRGLFNQQKAEQFIKDYDAAAIDAIVEHPQNLNTGQVKHVFCSPLNRSKLTARAIFGPNIMLIEDAAFREFERRIFRLPKLHLPIDFWLVTSRILWIFGWNSKDIETYKQARQRAREGARHLEIEADAEGKAVLVAHGFLNRAIEAALKKKGWKSVRSDGSGYLSVKVLEKSAQSIKS